jgi:hypothetical protein
MSFDHCYSDISHMSLTIAIVNYCSDGVNQELEAVSNVMRGGGGLHSLVT